MRIDCPRLACKIVTPYLTQKLFTRKHVSGMGRKQVQYFYLLRCTNYGLAVKRDRIALNVDYEAVSFDHM